MMDTRLCVCVCVCVCVHLKNDHLPLQNLGVPSHLIPAVIDAQKEATAAEAAAAAAKKEKVGSMGMYLCTLINIIIPSSHARLGTWVALPIA